MHRTTQWAITPHTQAKHLILRRYLEAWLPILSSYNNRIVYIDGFAGPGRYTGGEEGSPLIALRTFATHQRLQGPRPNLQAKLLFIESDNRRVEVLQRELTRLTAEQPIPSWIQYHVEHREFAAVMTEILDQLDRDHARLAPTFCFIDPFGFSGIPLDLVRRIGDNPRCECLITFVFDHINRFLQHPEEAVTAHFDDLFGTHEWWQATEMPDPDGRKEFLVGLYQRQLETVVGFEYVRTFEMINQGNHTAYFLYFGSHSKTGLSKMKLAMWNADTSSGQTFSDRTVTNQVALFNVPPDYTALQRQLRTQFPGRAVVSIEDVEDYVLTSTPFSEAKHLKRPTLKPMELATPPLLRATLPGGRRRLRGTYPPGALLEFL